MKYNRILTPALAAVVISLLICGFLMLRVVLASNLYRSADETVTLSRPSQSSEVVRQIDDISFSEQQINAYHEQAQIGFLEVFGITLTMEQMLFIDGWGDPENGYQVYLTWTVGNDGDEEEILQNRMYDALFQQPSLSNEAQLVQLTGRGDFNWALFAPYIDKTAALYVSQLNWRPDPHLSPVIEVIHDCQQDDTQVIVTQMAYYGNEYEAETVDSVVYRAVYEHCDLLQGTGQVQRVSREVRAADPGFTPELFSAAQRTAAIESLRVFGLANDIPLGEVTEQKPWVNFVDQSAMSITFKLEDDPRSIRFVIGMDLTIYRYEYIFSL